MRPPEDGWSIFLSKSLVAHRALEHIEVKTREAMRATDFVQPAAEASRSSVFLGAVRVTAGLEIRFQIIDPAHPPQLVLLKLGGAGRLLFVKLAGRDRETTRTDFQRVQPWTADASRP